MLQVVLQAAAGYCAFRQDRGKEFLAGFAAQAVAVQGFRIGLGETELDQRPSGRTTDYPRAIPRRRPLVPPVLRASASPTGRRLALWLMAWRLWSACRGWNRTAARQRRSRLALWSAVSPMVRRQVSRRGGSGWAILSTSDPARVTRSEVAVQPQTQGIGAGIVRREVGVRQVVDGQRHRGSVVQPTARFERGAKLEHTAKVVILTVGGIEPGIRLASVNQRGPSGTCGTGPTPSRRLPR